jgi:oligoendopeptidase F
MSTPPYMWPFSLFAPGNLTQPILPGWSFGNVSVNYAGNADIEKDVVEKVASYGKQLGIITHAVLELAGDKPAGQGEPLRQLRDIDAKVKKIKEEHRRSLAEQASDAMAKLAKTDEAEARRIARDYAGKTSG